jgi:hypothetical protein
MKRPRHGKMYSRYNRCPPVLPTKASRPLCPVAASPGPGAIPESARMAAQRCPEAIVRTTATTCGGTSTVFRLPVIPGGPVPVVDVRTTPASTTTQQVATAVRNAAPARFAEYFPPAPLPAPCPVRIPNNEPVPTFTCNPVTRFYSSAEYAAIEAAAAAPAPAPGPGPVPVPP